MARRSRGCGGGGRWKGRGGGGGGARLKRSGQLKAAERGDGNNVWRRYAATAIPAETAAGGEGDAEEGTKKIFLKKHETGVARVIDGKAISDAILEEVRERVTRLVQSPGGRAPELAVLLVGERRDSETYVRMKHAACERVGIVSHGKTLPSSASLEEVKDAVVAFNEDASVDGVLVQMPLPDHVDEEAALAEVRVEKDVDGFHPVNIGRLATKGRDPLFAPCTPRGCIELLRRTGTEISGARVCVLGRSNIVGMPVAALLQEADATVTVVHSRTPHATMVDAMRSADIIIAAAGRPEMVRGDWIKPGATVIDVGINPVEDASKKRGYRLVGDVCFDEAVHVAGKITPVPGGVGPMTIAMLMLATLESAERRIAAPL